jgi:hypothetical protein
MNAERPGLAFFASQIVGPPYSAVAYSGSLSRLVRVGRGTLASDTAAKGEITAQKFWSQRAKIPGTD